MLPIGAILQDYDANNRTKFTKDEQITMMTLWCIMRSPLMMGGDMVYNDEFTLSLLVNPDLLEMLSQSRSAHQLYKRTENGVERIVWTAFRKDGGHYLAVFNTSEESSDISVDFCECELEGEYSVYDIWEHKNIGKADKITVNIAPHGAKVYRLEN